MAKIKQGDNVIIVTGKEKGKQGVVLSVTGDRVKVEGLNMVVKHKKGNQMAGTPGERVSMEAGLHISNVAIVNAATQKADRIGYRLEADGKKIRVYKSSGEPLATA